MKRLPHIASMLYNEPWMITAAKHAALCRVFESRLSDGYTPDPDGDRPDMPEMYRDGSVAIIPVVGVLGKRLGMVELMCGGCDVDHVAQNIDIAEQDPSIEKVIFRIDSPGGTVTGIPELGRKIASMRKPTTAYTDTMCCSAGYWLASQCGHIYASSSASVGSIGVYTYSIDQSRRIENEGLKVNEFAAGKYKTSGAPWKPMTQEEKAIAQAQVDKIYQQFIAAVTSRRLVDESTMQGLVYDGEEAAMLNLTDGVVDDIVDLLS